MLSQSLVALIVAAAAVSAFDGEQLRARALEARAVPATATESADSGCLTALGQLASLVTDLPRPTGELSSFLVTAASLLTDPCNLSIPASVAPAFTAYESAVVSFYSSHSAQLNSALLSCPSLTSLVNNPVCSSAPAVVVTSASIVPASTVTSSVPASVTVVATTLLITSSSTTPGNSNIAAASSDLSAASSKLSAAGSQLSDANSKLSTASSGFMSSLSSGLIPSPTPIVQPSISMPSMSGQSGYVTPTATGPGISLISGTSTGPAGSTSTGGANAGSRNAGLVIAAGLAGAVVMAL